MRATMAKLLPLCALLGGCETTPSINVLGAFFPDWMFCIIGAVILTTLVHNLLGASGSIRRIPGLTLPLIYFALTVLFSFTGWLLFFRN